MSPPLKGPLEQHLEPAVDDAQIQKIARGLKAARSAPAPRRVWPLALAATAAAVLAVVSARALLRPTAPPALPLLALAGGQPLPAELVDAQSWSFSEGSRVTLDRGATLQVVANQPSQLTLLLKGGKSRFEVTPGGPRKWLIEAGLVTVEVVGTAFTVDRAADGVCVAVEHGTVVVRGEHLPDRLARLDAGMSTCARPEVAGPGPVKTLVPSAAVPSEASPTAPAPSADTLLKAADAAREAGDFESAAAVLGTLLRKWPADPNVPSAAFTLGVLELEKLGRPHDAARHFGIASKSPALVGDARLRQVEALVAAGDLAMAERVARAAIDLAPQSAHAGRLQRWLSDPQHAGSWLR